MIVADTDVLMDALRHHGPSVERVSGAIRRQTLATTTVTAFELLSGGKDENRLRRIRDLVEPLRWFAFDRNATEMAARTRRLLEAEGRTIGMPDLMIVGICLAQGLPLLTRNRRHFDRVPDLIVTSP